MNIGYALSCEEHPPSDLVRFAQRAEAAGFEFASISDHFHPWISAQGHSPFVWSVIGAIAHATARIRLGTGVTCPLIRTHPAIVAHASATCAAMMPGRFYLGVGTGENLNEHVTGAQWPAADLRLDMLEEAIEVIRRLWDGDEVTYRGRFYTVDHARLYTLPAEPPQLMVAAKGEHATTIAAELSDGLISTAPNVKQIEQFDKAGGKGKPRYGMVHVCWGLDEASARETAHRVWPTSALKGELNTELPLPRHFEQASSNVTEEQVGSKIVCGGDPDRHLEQILNYAEAGFDHIYIHQIGPDQAGFFDFYEEQILPKL